MTNIFHQLLFIFLIATFWHCIITSAISNTTTTESDVSTTSEGGDDSWPPDGYDSMVDLRFSRTTRNGIAIFHFFITFCIEIPYIALYTFRAYQLRHLAFINVRHWPLLLTNVIFGCLHLINSTCQLAVFLNTFLFYPYWVLILLVTSFLPSWVLLIAIQTLTLKCDYEYSKAIANLEWQDQLGIEHEQNAQFFINNRRTCGNSLFLMLLMLGSYSCIIIPIVRLMVESSSPSLVFLAFYAIFFGFWSYMAARVLKSIEGFRDVHGVRDQMRPMAKHLQWAITFYAICIILRSMIGEDLYRVGLHWVQTNGLFFTLIDGTKGAIESNEEQIVSWIKRHGRKGSTSKYSSSTNLSNYGANSSTLRLRFGRSASIASAASDGTEQSSVGGPAGAGNDGNASLSVLHVAVDDFDFTNKGAVDSWLGSSDREQASNIQLNRWGTRWMNKYIEMALNPRYKAPEPNKYVVNTKKFVWWCFQCEFFKYCCCCCPCYREKDINDDKNNKNTKDNKDGRLTIMGKIKRKYSSGGESKVDLLVGTQNKNGQSRSKRDINRSGSQLSLHSGGKAAFSLQDIIGDKDGFIIFSQHVVKYDI